MRPETERRPPTPAASVIWGRNTVIEALRAGRQIRRILVAEGARESGPVATILGLATERLIPVETVSRARLDQIATNHQGVAAEVAPFRYSTLAEMLARAEERKELPFLLLLDGVEDPQNLGTLMRTAEAVGIHGILIPKHRAVAVTGGVEKASAGAIEHVKVAQVANLRQVIDELKTREVWVAGVEASGEQPLGEADLNRPLAVVLGSEGRGISRLIREHCDFLVRLPMFGQINSLNVAVAGSIVLYEARRQRERGDRGWGPHPPTPIP